LKKFTAKDIKPAQLFAAETVYIGMLTLEKQTLGALCLAASAKYCGRRAFEIYREGKVYDSLSYREWGRRSRGMGILLAALGIEEGGRVLLLAENCPEWPAAYFGIALAGAVSVPLLTDFVPSQIGRVAAHARPKALCVTALTVSKTAGLDSSIPRVFLDSVDGAGILVSLKGVEKRLPLADPGENFPFPGRKAEDLAAIIYTSGTTGACKAVMLSNQNLISCARASYSLMKIFPRDRLLSVIPLAHTYECTLGLLAVLMNGASVTYLDKPPVPAVFFQAVQSIKPTAMLAVPLFIEKIYRQFIAPALNANPLFRCPVTRPLAYFLAGKKLMSAFGGSLRFFGLGGAPLAPEVENFLRKVKFPYSPGYGLSEAAPLLAGTAPYRFPPGSAGSVLKGVNVRIAENGEIQASGPNIMMGYYRDEEATAGAFTPDGWLKTGDIGALDDKNYLTIKGRLKALILGPSGENIYPEEIEELLNSSSLIEEALVVPGGKGEIVARVVLSEKAKAVVSAVSGALEELKKKVNANLAAFSRIQRIEVQLYPFEKTPTGKIKRFLYQNQIRV
jgi:long-chain acyl-CoA synthetase